MIHRPRINRKLEVQRQQEHWNEVHENLLSVQKKSLSISNPQDSDEREADEVARKIVNGGSASVNGTGGNVNRKGEGSAEITNEFQSKLESSKGGGQSLDKSTRTEMESKMGADLSGVKIHTGGEASNMSESINAKAFTHGQDIYFHNNHSPANKELLAHELVHTVQQSSGKIKPKIQRVADNTVQTNLANKDYKDALETFNINYFIGNDGKGLNNIGTNILEELHITQQSIAKKKLRVTEAGAIASDFGMLRSRRKYMDNAVTEGYFTDTAVSAKIDQATIIAKAKKIQEEYDLSDKSAASGKLKEDKRKALVAMVFNNPDMPIQKYMSTDPTYNKRQAVEDIYLYTGTPLSEDDMFGLLLDKTKQTALTASIKSESQGFYDAILKAGWIDATKYPKGIPTEVPDQFLAAVGDLTGSTGLANSEPSVGVGYFMYDFNSKGSTLVSGGNPNFNKNEINLTFNAGELVEIGLFAYGFDSKVGSKDGVKVTIDEVGFGVLATVDFMLGAVMVSGANMVDARAMNASGDVFISRGTASSTKLINIKIEPKTVTSDEIQVQVTSTGHIAQTTSTYVKKDVELNKEYAIGDLHFDSDKSDIKPVDIPTLDDLVKKMNENPTWVIEIQGHTDNKANHAYNQKLSDSRAAAVMAYVVKKGIAPSRMTSKGYAETKPVADNSTEAGRTQNRRVVFVVVSK